MVHEGENVVLVRVAPPPHFFGWLGKVQTGPDSLLEPVYQSELAWRHHLPPVSSLLGFGSFVLMFIFWFASRDPTSGP